LGELSVNFKDYGWFPNTLPSEGHSEEEEDDNGDDGGGEAEEQNAATTSTHQL
jgi:hypothetical protein